jgi:hypothetical protein
MLEIEGDHPHIDGMKVPYLVNRDENGMIPRFNLEIIGFWRFHRNGEKDRASTGRAYPEIAFPLIDIVDDFIGDDYILRVRWSWIVGVHILQ